MNKSVLMQKQVKDNADDLQKEFLDMKNWEEQMKCKEEELKQKASNEATVPAVRSKPKSKAKKEKCKDKCKKIRSCYNSALDKYDADNVALKGEACKETETKEEACKKTETKDKACKETKTKEEAYKEIETTEESSFVSDYVSKFEQDNQFAIKYKNKGNELVQRKQWRKAAQYYTAAIARDPTIAAYYANRSLCFIKLEDYLPAEIDCTRATILNPTYVKAYYRRAVARFNMSKFKLAERDAKRVLRLDPWNKEAKEMLEKVNDKTVHKNGLKHGMERLVRFERMWEHGEDVDLLYDDADAKYNEENKDINNRQSNSDATSPKEKKSSTEDTTDIKDLRISPLLKECCRIGLIQFRDIPPHLRSKRPLTKIEVEEMDLYRQQFNPDISTQRCSAVKRAPKKGTCTNNDLVQQSSCATISTPSEDTSVLPPPPRNAVDFILTWNRHKSSEFRYRYLKQLPPNSLADIFLYSMESEILSQILEVLRVEHVRRKDDVYDILKDISELKRFRALNSFFGASDKKCLEELFSYCKTAEKKSADEILSLREKYGL